VITLAVAIFIGGSINSAPCALEDINFTIGLNGITPNKEYCAGQDTKTTLSLSQLGNVVRWESSTDILLLFLINNKQHLALLPT
jgi:hypothetical protein